MFQHDHTLAVSPGEPNFDQLRAHGWSVSYSNGRYCAAWRGNEQATFMWTRRGWQQMPAQTASRAAA
ncbi:MAG: hypothetical protein ACRC7O_17110 [Fimbriiglobus sp.]